MNTLKKYKIYHGSRGSQLMYIKGFSKKDALQRATDQNLIVGRGRVCDTDYFPTDSQ
jgi:hypothetical protein